MNSKQQSFWWVNHKQTFSAEIAGGYIWSPQKNKGGGFNQTYENLALVRPGDVIVSYANTLIKAIGIATAPAQEQGRPKEFDKGVGENWSEHEGWWVPIEWTTLAEPISPKKHMTQIAPLLPGKHSPLQTNGNGNQGCYLASISTSLGKLVISLVRETDHEASDRLDSLVEQIDEDAAQEKILASERQATEKEQLIRARQGQGLFRQRLLTFEKHCRITGVTDTCFLIASHIKPWRDSSDQERLDGENGLLLAPHIDKLFDQGWISFADDGALLTADGIAEVLAAWCIKPAMNVGSFTLKQRIFLRHHRQNIFRTHRSGS